MLKDFGDISLVRKLVLFCALREAQRDILVLLSYVAVLGLDRGLPS